MKIYPIPFLIAFFAFASLYSLYLVFLSQFLSILAEFDSLEAAIFYTLALRAFAIFFIPRLRRIPASFKSIAFSFEMFVVVLYIFAYILTGDQGDVTVVATLSPAWIAATFYILLPYFISEFAIGMHKGEHISSVLTWGVLVLAESVFVANFAIRTISPPSSLTDMGQSILHIATSQSIPAIAVLTSLSNSVVAGAAVVFYMSMIAYLAYSQVKDTNYQGKFMFAVLLMLFGNLLLLGWVAAATSLSASPDMFLVLSTPAIILPLAFLVGFHERKG